MDYSTPRQRRRGSIHDTLTAHFTGTFTGDPNVRLEATLPCTIRLAEAHLAVGNTERARELAAEAIAISNEVRFPFGLGVAQRSAGRIAGAAGDLAGARASFEHALETFAAIPARLELASTRQELARSCAAARDHQP